ncbi:MAG: O-antigen ligase family protein, partial [Firmicutes bacterium]|nr:O-antigen ligase family protein [Bacillota bacterium]
DVSFNGASERYEGFWMWSAYMLFFATAIYYTTNRSRLNLLLCGLALGAAIVGTIGALQFFGLNPYENQSFVKMVMGKYYDAAKPNGGLSMTFSSVFSTLYNPNCVGIYTAMLCPVFLAAGIAAPVKKWYKYVLLAVFVLLLINLFGCESVGGLLGLAAGLAFSALVAVIYFIKKYGKKMAAVSLGILIVFAVSAVVVLNGNSKLMQKAEVIRNAVSNPESITNPFFFEDLKIDGNNAVITTKEGDIIIDGAEMQVYFERDGAKRSLVLAEADPDSGYDKAYVCYSSEMRDPVPGLEKNKFNVSESGNIKFTGGDGVRSETNFFFSTSGGKMTALDMFGNAVDIDRQVKSIGFEGMERLGSNRGYIWSRSLPVAFKNIIIGAGPDCFVFEFPQNDLLGKLRFLGNPNVVIDKAHSFYIQTAVSTGLLSLVLLIALFVIYIIDTVKAVFKNETDNFMLGLRLGIMGGVIGYLACVTTTDSVVSVSPVFWILLGIGFAVNKQLTEE